MSDAEESVRPPSARPSFHLGTARDAATRAARTLSTGSIRDAVATARRAASRDAVLGAAAAADGQPTGGVPGGYKAMAAFFLSLIAYTVQTEFAQHVQQALNYKKPFFSLYVGHSSFILILPVHLLLLKLATGRSIRKHYWYLITENLRWQTESRSITSLLLQRERNVDGLPSHQLTSDDAGESLLQRFRTSVSVTCGFDLLRLLGILVVLTLGITVPALSWYAAVPMTSMADITALYNCFALSALVFSVWFLGDRWQTYKVASVLLAVFGVVVVSYGGAEHKKVPRPLDPVHGKPDANASAEEFPHPFVGDMLALFGAVTMGLYEIAFKLIGTLPDEDLQLQLYGKGGTMSGDRRRSRANQSYIEYQPVSSPPADSHPEAPLALPRHITGEADYQATGSSPAASQSTSTRSSMDVAGVKEADASKADSEGPTTYSVEAADTSSSDSESAIDDAELEELATGGVTRLTRTTSRTPLKPSSAQSHSHRKRRLDDIPPPLPWGMHSNIMTSGIGLVTAFTLWLGLLIAHYTGWEPFEWPHNFATVASLATVAICGVFFNASFMILLSVWGPVLASVSCLLTTILVEIADVLLGRPLKLLSLIGCALIGGGFVVLIYGESRGRSAHVA